MHTVHAALAAVGGQASAVSSSAACLYDAAMGDAYGNRLTQYEHSVDFPPRSMEDDSEVSPCQLQEQRYVCSCSAAGLTAEIILE